LPGILDFSHVILGDCDSFLLTTKQDRQLAEAFQRQSQPSDVVLVPAKHHHWSLLWTGRPAVLGMRYFVWVHGIDAHELDRDVADIYAGGPKALDLLRKYSVRYVVTESGQFYENSRDQKLMGFMDQFFSPVVINESFFAARFPLVMDNGTEKVFRIPTE
jgi:hypothetical protein